MAFGKGILYTRPILLCGALLCDSACDAIVLVLGRLTWRGHTVFTSPELDDHTDRLGSLQSSGSLWSNGHRNTHWVWSLSTVFSDYYCFKVPWHWLACRAAGWKSQIPLQPFGWEPNPLTTWPLTSHWPGCSLFYPFRTKMTLYIQFTSVWMSMGPATAGLDDEEESDDKVTLAPQNSFSTELNWLEAMALSITQTSFMLHI